MSLVEARFMSKYEDEAFELIELVAENSHHHVAKSFGGRSAPAKGGMLDAKTVITCIYNLNYYPN